MESSSFFYQLLLQSCPEEIVMCRSVGRPLKNCTLTIFEVHLDFSQTIFSLSFSLPPLSLSWSKSHFLSPKLFIILPP